MITNSVSIPAISTVGKKALILGGVKSGKSLYAERLAIASTLPVTLIATANALDEEMHRRIAKHKASRPPEWHVVEEPLNITNAINTLNIENNAEHCVIVDCLTLWLTQVLCDTDVGDASLDSLREELITAVQGFDGTLIIVSNETNMGITPMGELSRRFCDEAGRMHQALASSCDSVTLMVAGIPVIVKQAI